MTRFVFDSGIASDYLNRRHGVFERARTEVTKGNRIGIGMPVLAELVAGIERSKTRDRNMQRLKSALASLKLWPFDQPAAFEYGRLYAELARLGRPCKSLTSWSRPSPRPFAMASSFLPIVTFRPCPT